MYSLVVLSVQLAFAVGGEVKYGQVLPTTTTRSLQVEEAFSAGITHSPLLNPLLVTFSPATSLANPRLALIGPSDFSFACQSIALVETAQDQSVDDFLASELACSTASNAIYVNITSVKPFLSSSNYTLTVTAVNPSVIIAAFDGADWSLLIRNSSAHLIDSAVAIPGFALTDPVVVFSVLNTLSSFYGSEVVAGVLGRMVLPAALVANDVITVQAPTGFRLEASSGECEEFRWVTSGGVVFSIADASVVCEDESMYVIIGPDGAAKNKEIRWTFITTNPATTPPVTGNFWRVQIFRADEFLYGQVSAGWQVIPQLADVEITSSGTLKAATRIGGVFLSFTAVSAADKVTLVASEPGGFDFSNAVALLNGNAILDAFGNTISVRIVAREGEVCQVNLGNVRLGNFGGQTVFNITTYWGGEKKDEKTNFSTGFVLPGLVTVVGSELVSERQSDEHPVSKDFRIPYNVDVLGKLRITFTQNVVAGSVVRVTLSAGYTAKASDFAIYVAGEAVSTSDVVVTGTNVVVAKVNVQLSKNTETLVVVGCTTPQTPSNVVTASLGSWRVDTFRPEEDLATALPSNTNDGMDAVQRLVVPMTFAVVPASCLTCGQQQPPGANIAVSLDLRPNGALPQRLYIIAPPNFEFAGPSCLRGYRGTDIVSCVPVGKTVGNRPVARLETRAGGLTEAPSGLRITAITPTQSPEDKRWQVRGVWVQGGVETETGWGESEGFTVLQMSQTVLYYPNLPTVQLPDPLNTKVWLTLGFRTKALFDMLGGTMEITMPNSFLVFCETLKTYKLPVDLAGSCSVNLDRLTNTLKVTVGFNDTMSATDYALAVAVQTPLATPQAPQNTFSIVLKDATGDVKDAAFGIYAHKVSFGYPILAPAQVYWEADNINIGDALPTTGFTEIVDFFTKVDFSVVKVFSGTEGVATIRIDFQPGVVLNKLQQTNTTGFGTFMSSSLEARVSDITMPSTSVLMLGIAPSKAVFPVGEYSISFPVTLPDATALPAHQFYTITFCRVTGTCLKGNGTALIVSHSIEGFQLLDIPPGVINANSGVLSSTCWTLLGLLLVLTLALN